MVPAAVVSAFLASPWFQAEWAPYLLLDPDLRILAVSTAYERATAHPRDRLLQRELFDAFPDDPADPKATGVANLSRSLEQAARRGTRQWMGFQRYDVPDLHEPGSFVFKVWTPVNVPVIEERRVVALLHHVQDVTPALSRADREAVGRYSPADLEASADVLQREFPHAPSETVLAFLTHSQRVVLETIGLPDPDRATELARIRLEVHTTHLAGGNEEGTGRRDPEP